MNLLFCSLNVQFPQTFAPEDVVFPITMRRVGAEDVDYHHFETAKSVKQIMDLGGLVLTGAHGEMQGLGYHWELRMFKSGNMSNLDVLKAGTVFPAKAHGLFHEIGSLSKGKLADLIFFSPEDSPLEDIWNAAKVKWVMKDGYMWNARDMSRILPTPKPAPHLPELNTKHV
jgi:imidazolonepropionase-like amidohydrolase